MKRQPTPPSLLRAWSTAIQFRFAEALPLVTAWTCHEIAFHGGTSLNMSWGSPRYSEDLDFLLSRDSVPDLEDVMKKAAKRIEAAMLLDHPGVQIDVRQKTRPDARLQHFQIVASHPAYLERCMVKVEFWPVDADYLKRYESEFVFPVRQGDIITRSSSPLPAATLKSAYADKLTAFATRPYLKWRDIFDIWWIDQQCKADPHDVADRFLDHVKGYETIEGLAPAQALEHFLQTHDVESVIEKADPDLKRWLPDLLWETLWPNGVRQMVHTAFDRIRTVADIVQEKGEGEGGDGADNQRRTRQRQTSA